LLDGDKLKNFLDFNDFLKKSKVTKGKTNKADTSWAVRYKNKMICHFRAYKDLWWISYFKQEELLENCGEYVTDALKEFILANINTNPGCGGCNGRENKIVLGKMFDRVCGCHLLLLKNPDGKALEYAKELVSINKNTVDDIMAGKT